MVAPPLRTFEVGRREESIDFSLFQISGGCLRAFLERYETDFLTPSDVLGAVKGHEAGQRVDRRQALVRVEMAQPGSPPDEEGTALPGRRIRGSLHGIDARADLPGGERYQKGKGVPIALLCTSGQIPLLDQVFEKEAPDPGTESAGVSHGSPPRKHIGRSVCWLRATARESS